ncbi:MAG: DUF1565 domain-containing protein [Alphaproteobacteria bacterium]|nr:DUF1565 domain-containing protein [Alphaproteobacteria bacterium]
MNAAVRALLLASLLMPAAARAAVTISPRYAQVVAGQTLQFTASPGVSWEVNNAIGGTAATGTISKTGLFTAPATLPKPAMATISVVSKTDPSQTATATVTLLSQAQSGRTYYVSTSGSDGNDGSIGAPWRTIQHAADTAAAGDIVLVHGGVYNEHVTLSKSGNPNGYIAFESAPGETAVVDGTGLDIPQNMWGLFTFQNVSYVIVEGFEVRNYTTASDKQVPIGIFVVGAGEGDQIVSNYVHDITTTAPANPTNCASDAFGITVYGTQAPAAIDGLALSGNEVAFNHTGCSETLSLDGNVTNFAVVSNVVHDDDNIGIGAIGFEHVSNDPAYDQARDGVIRGNTVYNITSYGNPDYGKQYAADGIYVDGGTNIVIDQNRIHTVDLGIELASEHKGKTSSYVIARNNLVYGGNSAGISIGGYKASKGGTDHCTIVGNTLYGNDTKNTGSGEFQIQFNATNNVFDNNIVYAGAQGLLVNDFTTSTPSPAALDYNLYFSAGPSNFIWQKQRYKTFASYVSGSGNDGHSSFADPQFADTTNFDVVASSPAVNAGTNLGPAIVGPRAFIGTKRILGGAIDIGAWEQ